VGDIQEKLLSHPLAPLLKALGMAGGAEPSGAAGKHQDPLLTTVRTADPGKPAVGIAAVKILLDNVLDDRPEVAVLLLKTALILRDKPIEIMENHPVEDGPLRMSRTIDSCHSRNHKSRNEPRLWIRPRPPERTARAPAQKGELGRKNVNSR